LGIADLFLVLTAARTNDVLDAKWSEIDLEQAAWTIPAGRMKAGRKHRVTLAPRCIELLKQAKLLSAGSEFVFPGRSGRSRCRTGAAHDHAPAGEGRHGARSPVGLPRRGLGAHQFCPRDLQGLHLSTSSRTRLRQPIAEEICSRSGVN
jgi:integrase